MKHTLLTLLLALISMPLLAEGDSGLWAEVGASKDFGKKWSISGDVATRTDNDFTRLSRWSIGTGASYKPCKWVKLGAGYSFMDDKSGEVYEKHYNKSGVMNGYNYDEPFWRNKHRFYFDVTGKAKAGRFSFSLRERYQYTRFAKANNVMERKYRGLVSPGYSGDQYDGFILDSEGTDTKGAKDKNILRSRLGIEYNIRHCPVTPGITYELFNDLTDGMHLDKQRVTAGIEWKITKHYFLSAAYVYQHGNGDGDEASVNFHAIDLGFNIKF